MKHYEATLPFFCGFYYTWADDLCSAQECDIEYIAELLKSDDCEWIDSELHADFKRYIKESDQDTLIDSVCEDYVWEYDHSQARAAFCNEYAQAVCQLLDVPYQGQELTSPRYYNYETDKIHVKLDAATLKKWVKRLKRDSDLQAEFASIIKSNCTSYDGFISFHSNELQDYLSLPISDWDNIKAGFLLEAVLRIDCADDMRQAYSGVMEFEEALIDGLQGNGFAYEFTADINAILKKHIDDYRDANDLDDYIKPLPSKYLKGEIMQINISN